VRRFDTDEHVRSETTLAGARITEATQEGRVVTAGNAKHQRWAAALILASAEGAFVGRAPGAALWPTLTQGRSRVQWVIGPVPATRCFGARRRTARDLDVVESNKRLRAGVAHDERADLIPAR